MICPNCGAIGGVMNLDEMFGHHSVHGHPSHDPYNEGASMLAVALAVGAAALAYIFSDSSPHYQHHCSKCGYNW